MKNLFLHRSGKCYFPRYIPVDLRKQFDGRSEAVAFSRKSPTMSLFDATVELNPH